MTTTRPTVARCLRPETEINAWAAASVGLNTPTRAPILLGAPTHGWTYQGRRLFGFSDWHKPSRLPPLPPLLVLHSPPLSTFEKAWRRKGGESVAAVVAFSATPWLAHMPPITFFGARKDLPPPGRLPPRKLSGVKLPNREPGAGPDVLGVLVSPHEKRCGSFAPSEFFQRQFRAFNGNSMGASLFLGYL